MSEVDLEKVQTVLCDCFGDAFRLKDLEFELHKLVDEKFRAHRKAIQLADEVERLREESKGYRLMVCRKACKMHYPIPDGELSPFDENARLREALEQIGIEILGGDCTFVELARVKRMQEIARAALPKDEPKARRARR